MRTALAMALVGVLVPNSSSAADRPNIKDVGYSRGLPTEKPVFLKK
jgi:hypothetical protein